MPLRLAATNRAACLQVVAASPPSITAWGGSLTANITMSACTQSPPAAATPPLAGCHHAPPSSGGTSHLLSYTTVGLCKSSSHLSTRCRRYWPSTMRELRTSPKNICVIKISGFIPSLQTNFLDYLISKAWRHNLAPYWLADWSWHWGCASLCRWQEVQFYVTQPKLVKDARIYTANFPYRIRNQGEGKLIHNK